MPENTFSYDDFDHALHADKVLHTCDNDIDKLLKFYNLSTDALDTMISSIRDWYEKQPHLPRGQLHDRMILGQLITRGFSVEQSKENIDNYFAARHKMPEILCDLDPTSNKLAKYIKEGAISLSPIKTEENHRILISRIMNPEELIALDIIKMSFIIRDYRMFNDTAIGEHWIVDMTNASLSNIFQMTPLLLSKVYYHVTSCYAPKVKGIHFVNTPSYGATLINLFKKVMKPKHVSRFHVHDSFEKVFDYLPRSAFPKDLGGTADITTEEISRNIYEAVTSEPWMQFLKHQEKHFITDESKRLTPPKEYNDRFGVEGSFRKLELD